MTKYPPQKTGGGGGGLSAPVDATDIADGSVTNTEFEYINTLTSNAQTQLNGKAASVHTHVLTDITDVTITKDNLNSLDDGVNSTLHFHDSDRARANHTGTQLKATISDFAHTHPLSEISDVTASAAEVNILDGATLTVTELNYVDGVTSAIQTQLDGKQAALPDAANIVYSDISNTYTAGMKQIFGHSATTAGINLGDVASDPSVPVEADIWYHGSQERIKYRGSSSTFTLAGVTTTDDFSSGTKTFRDNILKFRNPANTFSYSIRSSAIGAAYDLSLPLLTGNDTIAVTDLAQTFINKSIDADTNTITNIENAEIKAAAGIVYSKLNLTNSIVDGDIVSITTRGKLPSGIAYEDETNTFSVDQNISATKKLFLDGGGDTYIVESAADVITFTQGGNGYTLPDLAGQMAAEKTAIMYAVALG